MAAREKTSAVVLQEAPATLSGAEYRTANRRAQPHPFQRFDDAEAGGSCFVGREEHIARMQRTVANTGGAGKIDCAGELRNEGQDLFRWRGGVVPHGDVQGLSRDVFLGPVGHRAFDT